MSVNELLKRLDDYTGWAVCFFAAVAATRFIGFISVQAGNEKSRLSNRCFRQSYIVGGSGSLCVHSDILFAFLYQNQPPER